MYQRQVNSEDSDTLFTHQQTLSILTKLEKKAQANTKRNLFSKKNGRPFSGILWAHQLAVGMYEMCEAYRDDISQLFCATNIH